MCRMCCEIVTMATWVGLKPHHFLLDFTENNRIVATVKLTILWFIFLFLCTQYLDIFFLIYLRYLPLQLGQTMCWNIFLTVKVFSIQQEGKPLNGSSPWSNGTGALTVARTRLWVWVLQGSVWIATQGRQYVPTEKNTLSAGPTLWELRFSACRKIIQTNVMLSVSTSSQTFYRSISWTHNDVTTWNRKMVVLP